MGYTHTIVRNINYGKVKETKTTEEVFGCPVTEDFEKVKKVETPENVNVLPAADVAEEITEKVKELREER